MIFTDGITKITDGLTLYACHDNPRIVELGSFGLNGLENGRFVPDDFRHEHYLLIEEENKRVLISGCSHRGINNIVGWFEPDVLVGGFHFSKMPLDGQLRRLAEQLDSYHTAYYTCHCTGVEQYRYMKEFMRRLDYLSTGKTIEIP